MQKTARRRFIFYRPPDWGQPLSPKDTRGAYQAVLRFLDSCAALKKGPEQITLEIVPPYSCTPPDYDYEGALERAEREFGAPIREGGKRERPEVVWSTEWRVPGGEMQRVVDFLAEFPRVRTPPHLAPVSACTGWELLLRDPVSGAMLPHQWPEFMVLETYSRITLHLGGPPSANFYLFFPFEEPGEKFLAYLGSILPFLPFRVAWKRFSLCTPNARGTNFARRRIDPSVLKALRA